MANKYNYMNLIVCRSSSSNSSNMASALHESLSSFFVLFPSFLMYSIVYASNALQRIHSLSFQMNHHIEMFCSLDLCTYTYVFLYSKEISDEYFRQPPAWWYTYSYNNKNISIQRNNWSKALRLTRFDW